MVSMRHLGVEKIISGGQTGADRGGLDAAIVLGIPIGGYVPRGRKAEDGRVPDRYTGLVEMETDDYQKRTRYNVAASRATVVFHYGTLDGGSLLTSKYCLDLHVPSVIVSPKSAASVRALRLFLKSVRPAVLNVAGNRESKSPGIQVRVRDVLVGVLS